MVMTILAQSDIKEKAIGTCRAPRMRALGVPSSGVRPKMFLEQSASRTLVIPGGGMSPTSEIMEAITSATSGAA